MGNRAGAGGASVAAARECHPMNQQIREPRRRRAPRQPTRLWRVPVRTVARVTPRLARVTVGGEQLADFTSQGTDSHVKLYFYDEGVRLPDSLTLERARSLFSRMRPRMRSYTIRRHDRLAHEIDIDFVLHDGHDGPATRWARQAAAGDELIMVGPSPAYAPDPATEAHLLVGDETALPAIAAILAELPAEVRVFGYVEVADAAERQPLPTEADAEIHWLYRDGVPAGRSGLLADAVRAATLPAGTVDAWVAGEHSTVRDVRGYLLDELRMDRRRVRTTSYWRHGETGDGGAG
ncbi:MAG: siderophore-interacting protein [Sciscionella sp.]